MMFASCVRSSRRPTEVRIFHADRHGIVTIFCGVRAKTSNQCCGPISDVGLFVGQQLSQRGGIILRRRAKFLQRGGRPFDDSVVLVTGGTDKRHSRRCCEIARL